MATTRVTTVERVLPARGETAQGSDVTISSSDHRAPWIHPDHDGTLLEVARWDQNA